MFSQKFIVAFIFAILAICVESAPINRRTCRRRTATSTIPSATQLADVASVSHAVTTSAAIPTTTSKGVVSSSGKPVSVTSTSKPAPTSGAPKGLLGHLFPVASISRSWTTSPSAGNALSLSDAAFRPFDVLRSVVHTYKKAPDGKDAMVAHYPEGSYTFGHNPQGGFSFYAPGPANVDLTTAKEATFGYSIFFPEGFDFNLGGKLPGLYGGNSDDEAVGCSGGSRSAACFSARLMWRTNGAGEFYTYLPPTFAANKAVCNVAPESDCNPTYGASVGRGSFKFATGAWTTISERVRLNDVGQSNGELELFVNGKSVINVDGLVLRNSAAGKIRGLQMQTFFGGSKPSFASPKSQDVFFSDFSVAITKSL